MKGVLKAVSLMDYGIYVGKDKVQDFKVPEDAIRLKINVFLEKECDFDRDIAPIIKAGVPVVPVAPKPMGPVPAPMPVK